MEVRIGVTDTPKELVIDLGPKADLAILKKEISAALDGSQPVLWLVDRRGRQTGLQSSKIAYVELSSDDAERRVGFGA